MSRISKPVFSSKLAAVGLIVAACALGGCGRKGALDLPPGAAAQVAPQDTMSAPQASGVAGSQYGMAGAAATAQGNVFDPTVGANPSALAPRGVKKRIFLDPILD